jgi:hypothetical protein
LMEIIGVPLGVESFTTVPAPSSSMRSDTTQATGSSPEFGNPHRFD